MKVFKPAWINHNGLPICSIDIHPDGSRVATGGQGEDSGRVVIWNMAPVMYEDKEVNENVPRILCQLDNHLACVNSVRWNCSGKYLASGGDDKLVMIWAISKSGGGGGLGLKSSVESWRCVATLRGHHGDVLDMAWSPHDVWLATCSVDNTVIVWRTDSNPPGLVTVLRGHSGLVKGVSWDPVGKYLSSQSDDKTVRVWRTSDWTQESVIQEPFSKCSGTTLVLRLGWSPDGQYLVTAHAMNGKVPTAQIIDREGWTHDKDFVGHTMAVTCVRFSGVIMEMEHEGKVSRSCCCVLGSRDRSLSVWITCLTRPVVVLNNLFSCPVNDLTWGPKGLDLMACSGDGSVAYLQFSNNELGNPVSQTIKEHLFEKRYGKSSLYEGEVNLAMLENPELLSLKSDTKEKKQQHQSNPVSLGVTQTETKNNKLSPVAPFCHNSTNSCSSRQLTPPTTKQIETRRADGKRRITPIFIPPPSSDTIGDEVGPFSSDTNTTPFSSSVQTKSKIVVERLEDCSQSEQGVAPPLILPTTGVSASGVTSAPVVVDTDSNCVARPPPPPPPSHPAAAPPVLLPPPSDGGFNNLMGSTEKSLKRRHSDAKEETAIKMSKATRGSGTVAPPAKRQLPLPAMQVSTSPANNSRLQLYNTKDWVLIDNGLCQKWANGPPALIKRISHTTSLSLWTQTLGSQVVGTAACRGAVAVGTKNASLHLFDDRTGCPLFPPVALPSEVSLLSSPDSGRALVCITTDGSLYAWKFKLEEHPSPGPCSATAPLPPTTLLSAVSMAPLLHPQEEELQVKECFVNEDCEPLVAMSNGKAYMYSIEYKTWFVLSDSFDPVTKWCLNMFKSSTRIPTNGPLPLKTLQTAATNAGISVKRNAGGIGCINSEMGILSTMSYLQTQISRSLALKSMVEYKFWILAFARFLLDHGIEDKLREICQELLGPSHSSTGQGNWCPTILGVSKHLILKDVLNEIGSNLKMQRLFLEFQDLLALVELRPS